MVLTFSIQFRYQDILYILFVALLCHHPRIAHKEVFFGYSKLRLEGDRTVEDAYDVSSLPSVPR